MCQTNKPLDLIKIAFKPIRVWKFFRIDPNKGSIVSPYFYFEWKIGQKVSGPSWGMKLTAGGLSGYNIKEILTKSEVRLREQGFHSFTDMTFADEEMKAEIHKDQCHRRVQRLNGYSGEDLKYAIGRCEIPMGARYVKGSFYSGVNSIVSDEIKLIEIIKR